MNKLFFLLPVLAAVYSAAAATYSFECTTNKKDAVYNAGEKISFTARILQDGKCVTEPLQIRYKVLHDGKTVKSGFFKSDEKLSIDTVYDRPGWVHLHLQAVREFKENGKVQKQVIKYQITKNGKKIIRSVEGGIGAMVEPLKIMPSIKEPEDFDEFWNNSKKALAEVPIKLLECKRIDSNYADVYDIKIACVGDKPVSGILCIPKNARPASCPAVVFYHGAGVRSANIPIKYAKLGAIAFDVNAHGIENLKPQSFYDDLRQNYYNKKHDEKRPGSYFRWYRDNREQYYMRNMFLRALRALEYIKTRPEWNKKHLIAAGTSQGGTQSIVCAALDKDVTFVRAGVPGWCDNSGILANRLSGGGRLYTLQEAKEKPEFVNVLSYFDCMFFTRRIKCPIYMNTGFIDTVCAPSSVFAAYNQLPDTTEKYMQTTPTQGHSAAHTQGHKALDEYILSIQGK